MQSLTPPNHAAAANGSVTSRLAIEQPTAIAVAERGSLGAAGERRFPNARIWSQRSFFDEG